MNRKAIYALSGDPITHGHINIIERARVVFDHVVIGIGINAGKKYTFDLKERELLARRVLERYPDVSVCSFEGLLVDFAFRNNIRTIIRGVRNTADFAFEQMLHDVNQSQRLGVDTFMLVADQKLSHVSSSSAKEIQRFQGKNVLEYVPMAVKAALEMRISGQYMLGVTGEIAAGKNFVAKKLERELLGPDGKPVEVHTIDLDAIGHEILEVSTEPLAVETRKKVNDVLELTQEKTGISMPRLRETIFKNKDALERFNEVMREPMHLYLRDHITGKKGVIIVNSALIAEENLGEMVNNNIVLVTASEETRINRMKGRGYTEEEIRRRMLSQWNTQAKRVKIESWITQHRYGHLFVVESESYQSLMIPAYKIGGAIGLWGLEQI